ncbi:Olfactory receptor 7G3 [Lemmus lemmus]
MLLFMYLITILENLLIIMAINSGSQQHTTMYLFLSSLSINDICYSTVTIPKILVNIQAQDNSVSYIECLSQMCFVSTFGGTENFLLAYDRYVAICKPLRYIVIMNSFHCVLIILFSLFLSIMDALLHSLMVLWLFFCTELEIPHFFYELAQIIKLACSDTFLNNFLIFAVAFLFGGGPVCGIIFFICLHCVLSLENAKFCRKAESLFHLCITSVCCFLVLRDRIWCVHQFCSDRFSHKHSNGFHNV